MYLRAITVLSTIYQYNTISHRPSSFFLVHGDIFAGDHSAINSLSIQYNIALNFFFLSSSQRYICGRSHCYQLSINTIQCRIDLLLLSSSQIYICGRSYCYQLSINAIQYRIDLLLLSSSQIYICGRSYCYQLSINA